MLTGLPRTELAAASAIGDLSDLKAAGRKIHHITGKPATGNAMAQPLPHCQLLAFSNRCSSYSIALKSILNDCFEIFEWFCYG
jgi:hypothetical protein